MYGLSWIQWAIGRVWGRADECVSMCVYVCVRVCVYGRVADMYVRAVYVCVGV